MRLHRSFGAVALGHAEAILRCGRGRVCRFAWFLVHHGTLDLIGGTVSARSGTGFGLGADVAIDALLVVLGDLSVVMGDLRVVMRDLRVVMRDLRVVMRDLRVVMRDLRVVMGDLSVEQPARRPGTRSDAGQMRHLDAQVILQTFGVLEGVGKHRGDRIDAALEALDVLLRVRGNPTRARPCRLAHLVRVRLGCRYDRPSLRGDEVARAPGRLVLQCRSAGPRRKQGPDLRPGVHGLAPRAAASLSEPHEVRGPHPPGRTPEVDDGGSLRDHVIDIQVGMSRDDHCAIRAVERRLECPILKAELG
jgi:hypothetical protein